VERPVPSRISIARPASITAPGIRWHGSGYTPTAGTYDGLEAVLRYLMHEDHMEDYRLEIIEVLAGVERVAVVAKASGRRGDRRLVNEFVQLVRVHDGRVAEVWTYDWDQRAIAEFLSVPGESEALQGPAR
jgi:ketosteroid isomerase-like protein